MGKKHRQLSSCTSFVDSGNPEEMEKSIRRFVELLLGHKFIHLQEKNMHVHAKRPLSDLRTGQAGWRGNCNVRGRHYSVGL